MSGPFGARTLRPEHQESHRADGHQRVCITPAGRVTRSSKATRFEPVDLRGVMSIRFQLASLLLSLLSAAACSRGGGTANGAVIPAESTPPEQDVAANHVVEGPAPVSVSLTSVRAVDDGGDLLFICGAVLHNRTGHSLTVLSNFFSAFDGLTIVVRSPDGQEVHRQPYIYHQSPYAQDQSFELPSGETRREIRFPIRRSTPLVGPHEVLLVGGLPGTPYDTGLISNTLRVEAVAD